MGNIGAQNRHRKKGQIHQRIKDMEGLGVARDRRVGGTIKYKGVDKIRDIGVQPRTEGCSHGQRVAIGDTKVQAGTEGTIRDRWDQSRIGKCIWGDDV